MNLIALPAFTANCIRMPHAGPEALVVDPDAAAPGAAAPGAQRLAPSAILVTHHHADLVGDIGGPQPRRRGPVHSARREPIRRSGTAPDRERRVSSFMRCAAPVLACLSDPHGVRCGFDQPVSVPAAPRHWTNGFR